MVNGFEEEVRALEEYGHDCCARIDDRIHECCKRIREAHEQELDNTRYAYEVSMALMKKQPSPVTYDVLGNERHKAVCELRKLPDGYPSYSSFPFAKWYEDLSAALGIRKGEVSCAKVRDTLIHLLGGDQVPATHGDPYGIWKGDGDGMDAGGCVEACVDRSDAAADGHMADSVGSQVSEGVAPITAELRAACGSANDMVSYVAIDSHDFDRICDAIDAVHAGLERENAELRERLAVLDNRSESMHIGSATVTITDELRKWAEGDALRAGMSLRTARDQALAIADRIDAEHERQLEVLYRDMSDAEYVKLLKDTGGEYIREHDKVDWRDHAGTWHENATVVALCNDGCYVMDGIVFHVHKSDIRHYHAPTVEDVLREMHAELDEVTALYVGEAIDSDERDRDEARIFAEFAAKLRLAEGEDA